MIHFLTPANISISSTEISNFCFIKKYSYRLCFHIYFLILLTLFESLKVALITIVAILMMSTKLAALSTIYMREVIITWILFKFGSSSIIWNWHKLWSWNFMQMWQKGWNYKSEKFRANSSVCRSYMGKTGRRGLFMPLYLPSWIGLS